jgi:hypothetical protein
MASLKMAEFTKFNLVNEVFCKLVWIAPAAPARCCKAGIMPVLR